MPDNVENLILEHLRAIRAGIDRTETKLSELVLRVAAVESHLGPMLGEIVAVNERLDHQSQRIDRIERRLHLVDAS